MSWLSEREDIMQDKLPIALLIATGVGLSTLALAEKHPLLPDPYQTPSTEKPATVLGWPEGKTPIAPDGFKVSLFADLESPRLVRVLPSGDILISQAKKTPDDDGQNSPNKITLFKMRDGAIAETKTFASRLHLPFGMAWFRNSFFIAEPTRILKFPYDPVNEVLTGPGEEIAQLPFPAPRRHWTRDLLINADGSKLYVSVGSVSNDGEAPDPLDARNAAILEMNLDGSGQRIFAAGLRNAVTMAWEPTTHQLWTTVNERDELGDGLVPDYITHVQDGGFYGWPYAYWGSHEDPRQAGRRPDLVAKTLVPDFSMGAHTAALGIAFTEGASLPEKYRHGVLVTQHGSWNSSKLVGYQVTYVPMLNGDAVDPEEVFLSGFVVDPDRGTVYGRPVSSAILPNGSILVTDDGANKVWIVQPVFEPRRSRR